MRRASISMPLAGLLAAIALMATGAPCAAADGPGIALGTQTHFFQKWPAAALAQATTVGARSLRDTVPWSVVERRPGQFDFATPGIAPLDAACRSGDDLLLTLVPRHPSYDAGLFVHSPAGIAAFARYATVLADRFGTCLIGIELGNEINSPSNLALPSGVDRAATYVALVRATAQAVHAGHPRVRILGGSTNTVGTGFLDGLFAAGLLDAADAIAVHPYRSHTEGLDLEIAHLEDTMRRHGRVLPIWATEFSDNFATPALAAPHLVKMTTVLAAMGTRRAFWYALLDEPYFRNMGLFDASRAIKPAGRAFTLIQRELVSHGPAVRVPTADPTARLYQWGADRWVAWGTTGTIRFKGTPRLWDAQGRMLPGDTVALSDDPVIITGASGFTAQPGAVLADSLTGYGNAPWTYWAQTGDGALHPLDWLDTPWSSSMSGRYFKPLRIDADSAATAGDAAHPTRVVLRYTAPSATKARLAACLIKSDRGDGVDITAWYNGTAVSNAILTKRLELATPTLHLSPGDTVDLIAGPNKLADGDSFTLRAWIVREGGPLQPPCP
jgi:hypothetical protein